LADLGDMMLLPKIAKRRDLSPARVGLFQFWTPIRRKIEESKKHKRRIFSKNGQTKFRDFPHINSSLDIFF
jgi:hypothetical protein